MYLHDHVDTITAKEDAIRLDQIIFELKRKVIEVLVVVMVTYEAPSIYPVIRNMMGASISS